MIDCVSLGSGVFNIYLNMVKILSNNSGLDENIIGSVSYDYALGSIIKVQICEHKEIVTL